jgi:hypothetical protein
MSMFKMLGNKYSAFIYYIRSTVTGICYLAKRIISIFGQQLVKLGKSHITQIL